MIRMYAFVILAVAAASGALAQTNAASAAEESFRVLPKTLTPGTNNVAIRLEARAPDLFASESSRTPRLSFSTGVTLVANSFRLLGPGEAEATVNVAADAGSTAEARVTIYSVDGKKALRQERGTIGIAAKKTVTLANPAAPNIEAGKVLLYAGVVSLIQTNADEPQQLGDLVIDGKAAGEIVINPPTGTVFVSGMVPTVAVESGTATIQLPRLEPGLGAFRFTIFNNAYAAIKVKVSGIFVNTADFSRLGGTAGTLATSISGFGLGPGVPGASGAQLVTNAHTALAKLEGSAITDTGLTPDPAPTTPTTPAPTTPGTVNTPATSGSGVSSPRRDSDREASDQRRRAEEAEAQRRRDEWRSRMNNPGSQQPGQSGFGRFSSGGNRWADGGFRAPPPSPSGSSPGGAGAPGSSGGGGSGGTGDSSGSAFVKMASPTPAQTGAARDSVDVPLHRGPLAEDPVTLPDFRLGKPTPLKASNRIWFADRDWNPVAGVVLKDGIAGDQRSRIWIVLERGEDVSTEIDTIDITVRFGQSTRIVTLTETGKATGVFRCDPAGIEVAAVGVHRGS